MNVQDETVSKETVGLSRWVMGVWLLILFWLGDKPVHLDEANFLAMTKGEFWSPHLIQISGKGETNLHLMFCRIRQGWYGYCGRSRDLSIGWMRLWILPWSVFAIWGMSRCIQYSGASKHVVWLMLCSLSFALSHIS